MDGKTYTALWEGLTLTAKPDAHGKWVIGRGHDIAPPSAPIKWTLDEADAQYERDYASATANAQRVIGIPSWVTIDTIRQAALVDMAFELGASGLAEFSGMLGAVAQRNWQMAHDQCLASKYDSEVPERCTANASILLTGEWPNSQAPTMEIPMPDSKPQLSPVHVGIGAAGAAVLVPGIQYVAAAAHLPPMNETQALSFASVLVWAAAVWAAKKSGLVVGIAAAIATFRRPKISPLSSLTGSRGDAGQP